MSKTRRFIIVLVVLGIAFAFLFPTLKWYFWTPKENQALASGSREQIREYSRRMAVRDITQLKAKVNDPTAISASQFGYAITVATQSYKDSEKAVPKVWTAKAVLSAFNSEKDAYDAVESKYREDVLALKATHGKALQLGLDLSGGMSATIQADLGALAKKMGHPLSEAEHADAMKRAIDVLSSRLDTFGLSEPVIRQQGGDQIYVEIPGTPDPDRINSIIMGKGKLGFYIVDSDATNAVNQYLEQNPLAFDDATLSIPGQPNLVPAGYMIRKGYDKDKYGLDEFNGRYYVVTAEPGLDGGHVQSAQVSRDSITGSPETTFALDKEGGESFYKLTSANVNKPMAVILDDHVKSVANIQEAIHDQVRMTGFGEEEAENLAVILRSAALPVELSVVSQQAIGASLGSDAIQQGKLAIIWGLAGILVFMLFYYKGSGINAMIAQILNLYLMISILTAFKLTLTLSSIAGFVLTVGMAVDANVIIFERIKEELWAGKDRKAAIEAGFDHAFWSVMDSNITTIIAALFLSMLGTGTIKGFAISLAIGNISSLFTSLFVSRLIFDFETDVLKLKHVSVSWRIK